MKNPAGLLSFNRRNRLPIILQTEIAECGLASIAMIACFHGHELDLNTLRRDFPISMKGTTLKNLMVVTDRLKFSSRALQLELRDLPNLCTPCILHWDLNHFVVLKKATKHKITIHDPAQGERVLQMQDASKHFSGVALELFPSKRFEKKVDKVKMKFSDLWDSVTGLNSVIFRIFGLSVLLQVFALVSPFYMQLVVDNVIVGNDTELLLVLALGFLLLVFIKVGTETLRSYVIMYLGSQLNIQIVANLFRHLLHLPLVFFEKRHIGDIVSRFRSIDRVKDLMTTGLVETVVDGIMTITTLVMMFIYSPKLALIVFCVVLCYAVLRVLMYQPFKNLTKEAIVADAKEDSNFMETVRAVQSIRTFGRESQRQTVWHNLYARAMNTEIRLNKLKITYKSLNDILFGIENVIVIYFGASLVLQNSFSVGMLYAFMAYKWQFSQKASAVIEKLIEFQMLGLHLDRIADIAMTPQEVFGERMLSNSHNKLSGEITLQNLGFQYSEAEPMLYENINFKFKAGESVALVGASGCGKTTLMKNMLGLLEPTKGKVLFDGVDIRQFGLNRYRNHVGAVMQDDQLLSGSILDNISFFDPEVDHDRVRESAIMSSIDTDIANMPMGYNTLIGDMGTTLSGGQRQRLLLARALYRRPKLLFLDEATSHLDTKLESIVNDSIKQLSITRIIIAHRPETIISADKIVRLANGELKEELNE